MAYNEANQLRKEADIKAEIARLLKNRFTLTYVLEQVAYKFYLTPTTIERIYWGEYDNRRTLKQAPASVAAYSREGAANAPPV